jgi:hypothetical protein
MTWNCSFGRRKTRAFEFFGSCVTIAVYLLGSPGAGFPFSVDQCYAPDVDRSLHVIVNELNEATLVVNTCAHCIAKNEAMRGSVYNQTNVAAGCSSPPSVRSNTTIPPSCDILRPTTKYPPSGLPNCIPPILTNPARTRLTSFIVEDEDNGGISARIQGSPDVMI